MTESHDESQSSHQPAAEPIHTAAPVSGGCSSTHGCTSESASASPSAEIAFVPTADASSSIAQSAPTATVSASVPVAQPVTAEIASPVAAAPIVAQAPIVEVAQPVAAVAIGATEGSTVVEAAQVASAPAPTATAVLEAPRPTLAESTADDLAAALATAQRARSRAKSNARGPRPADLIEKKIVIRRESWDALVQLTETLRSERGVRAESAEVAAIVLEAGLGAIHEESRARAEAARAVTKAPKSPKALKAQVATTAVTKGAKPTTKAKGKVRGKARALKAPKPTRAAAAKPRTFSVADIDGIKKLVRGLNSDRSVQRTLALWLGAHPVKGGLAVPIEDLRSLCKTFKVYDTANFAQNMKKDSAFFTEVRDKAGDRLGYSLTPAGVNASSGLFATAK